MHTFYDLVKRKPFFSGLIILLLFCSTLLLFFGKSIGFIPQNSCHPFWLNVFFINYTFIGDGIFACCFIGMIFFYYKRKQQGLTLLFSFIIAALIVQTIKYLASPDNTGIFFEAGQYLHFENQPDLVNDSNFSSGHTATAFAIATVFVLTMKNKRLELIILLMATLVGYSRIYLAQHFLIDVVIGATIGVLSGVLSVYLITNAKKIKQNIFQIFKIDLKNEIPQSAI